MFSGVLVEVEVDCCDRVDLWVSSGINCGIRFLPSLVTWTVTSCPSIERTTS